MKKKRLIEAAKLIYDALPIESNCYDFAGSENFADMNYVVYGNDAESQKFYELLDKRYFYARRKINCSTNQPQSSEQDVAMLLEAIKQMREYVGYGMAIMNKAMIDILIKREDFLFGDNGKRPLSAVLISDPLNKDPLAEIVKHEGVVYPCDIKLRDISEDPTSKMIYGRRIMRECQNILVSIEYPLALIYAICAYHEIYRLYAHYPKLIIMGTENIPRVMFLARQLGVATENIEMEDNELSKMQSSKKLSSNLALISPKFMAYKLLAQLTILPHLKQKDMLYYFIDEPFEEVFNSSSADKSLFIKRLWESYEAVKKCKRGSICFDQSRSFSVSVKAVKTFTELYPVRFPAPKTAVNETLDNLIETHQQKISSLYGLSQ